LLLRLKRFGNTLKNTTSRVSFPATMIKEVIPAVDNQTKLLSSDYSLVSVIHHLGNRPNSGHYTADALRPVEDVEDDAAKLVWFNFDDARTAHQETRKITANPMRQQTAFVLLYSRVHDSNSIEQ
jgi:ubiquitin C-terminal hydrolase